MDPRTFLKLAPEIGNCDGDEYVYSDSIIEDYMASIVKGDDLPMAKLFLAENETQLIRDVGEGDIERCRVYSHDGRHRAHAAANLGVEKMPVILYFEKYVTDGKYGRHLEEVDKDEQKCIPCTEKMCDGTIESEVSGSWREPGYCMFGGQPIRVRGDVLDIPWNEMPRAEGQPRAWKQLMGLLPRDRQ